MGLRPIKRERFTLNTFGSENYSKKECNLVQVKLQGKSGITIEILALGFPVICSPLQTPVAVDQYSHLQDLDLADDSPVDHNLDTIDVLIGSDHYWDVFTGGIIRGINGPVAISSNLGWLLLGPSESTGDRTISNLVVEGREIDDRSAQDDTELEDRLHQFWDTEAIGIFEYIK